MLGKLAEAYVEISTRRGPFDKGLAQVEGRLRGWVGQMSGVANIAVSIGGGLALGLATRQLYQATQMASDLGETQSKLNEVFKGSSSIVTDYADTVAQKYGLVKRETLDAAAAFGLVLQATGMTKDESAKLSVALAQAAADASSFYNISFADALEKLRSGLVGEAEPMRALGVLLDENAVKQEAMASGVAKNANAIDGKTKTAVRATLMLRGLATASGDLERTQNSLSNQQKKLAGEWENLQTQIGAKLIPIGKEFVSVLHLMVAAFGDVEGASKSAFEGSEARILARKQMAENTGDWAKAKSLELLRPLTNRFGATQRWSDSILADIQGRQVAEMNPDAAKPIDSPAMRQENARLADLALSPEAKKAKEAEAEKARAAAEEAKRVGLASEAFVYDLKQMGLAALELKAKAGGAGMAALAGAAGLVPDAASDPFRAQTFGSQMDAVRQLQMDILGGDEPKKQTAALKEVVSTGRDQLDVLKQIATKGLGAGAMLVKGRE